MAPGLQCFVEVPKGSRNRYTWDDDLGALKLDRFLFSSMVYPTDFGFVPGTLAPDGAPLDAMVCVTEPTFPGCVIAVKAVALLEMHDDQGPDDKVLCVPDRDPDWNHMEDLEDLPVQLREEIAHFFSIYKQPEGLEPTVSGWATRVQALAAIEEGRREAGRLGRRPAR